MSDELDPREFEDTAKAVVEACVAADDGKARAQILAETGLLGILAPEEIGGLGLPLRYAVPVVSAAGAGLLAFPLIEALVLAKALAGIDVEAAGRICSGETLATIAWSGSAEDGMVENAPMAEDADSILIFRADGSAIYAPVSNVVHAEASEEWDLEAPAASVRCNGPLNGLELDAATVSALKSDANILRAAYIHGSALHCLSLAVDYAQDRVQFGKPLSAYQALRHKLSRNALTAETIGNGITRALSDHGGDEDLVREAAWLNAARNGPGIAEDAIQVFGGMGFTWEVPLHRHLRQMRAQSAYGAASERLETFGSELLKTAQNDWYGEA